MPLLFSAEEKSDLFFRHVMITHDDEIAQVADRILVIEDGQVVDFR